MFPSRDDLPCSMAPWLAAAAAAAAACSAANDMDDVIGTPCRDADNEFGRPEAA